MVTTRTITNGTSWPVTMAAEGYQLTNTIGYGSNATAALTIGQSLAGYKPVPGSNVWIDSISVTSSIPIQIWAQRTNSSIVANGAVSMTAPIAAGPGFSGVISVQELLPEGETLTFTLRTAVAQAASSSAPDFTYSCGFTGRRMTNDLDFVAPKVWLAIGDSITNTTGPTYGRQFYHFLTKEWLRSQGKNYRLILKGDGGWASNHAEAARLVGNLAVPQADLVTYMLGTNDATLSAFQTNFPTTIGWLQQHYPNAQKVILGSPPRQGTPETVLATIRSYAQSYVASLNDPSVSFITLGSAFNNTDDTYYFTGDSTTAGARVHPNAAGHALMATTLQSGLLTTGAFLRL